MREEFNRAEALAERQARRHGRLRAHHPAAPAGFLARGHLPVAAPPPRTSRKPAARAGAAAARRQARPDHLRREPDAGCRGRRGSGGRARERGRGRRGGDPRPGHGRAHHRRAEGRDRDPQAPGSRWPLAVRRSGEDTKWRELASLLGEIFTPAGDRRSRWPRTRCPYGAGPIPPPNALAASEARHLHRAPRHAELPREPHHHAARPQGRRGRDPRRHGPRGAHARRRSRSSTTPRCRCCSPPTPPAKASTSSAPT